MAGDGLGEVYRSVRLGGVWVIEVQQHFSFSVAGHGDLQDLRVLADIAFTDQRIEGENKRSRPSMVADWSR